MGDCLFPLASSRICCMDNPLIEPEKQTVPSLLKKLGIKPSLKLGQNFLQDPVYVQKVVSAAQIENNDTVVEIGAGIGNLTRSLVNKAGRVIAFEIDPKFFPVLDQLATSHKNLQVIQSDILKVNLEEYVDSSRFLVVANIPYYITSRLIRYLLSLESRPTRIILTIQLEVAQRICAGAGKLSMLALSVQVYGTPQIISRIPAGAFYPVPDVDSAILRIDMFSHSRIKEDRLDTFFMLANAGFSQKRKTLRNSLSNGLKIDRSTIEKLLIDANIDPGRRAETLSLVEWEVLTNHYLDL